MNSVILRLYRTRGELKMSIRFDDRGMKVAFEEAKQAKRNGNYPYGCCIISEGQIIIRSHNTTLTQNNSIAHAEMNALNECFKKGIEIKKGGVLYTTVQPCIMCIGACFWAHIAKIYYGCSISKISSLGYQEPDYDYSSMGWHNIMPPMEEVGKYWGDQIYFMMSDWAKYNRLIVSIKDHKK